MHGLPELVQCLLRALQAIASLCSVLDNVRDGQHTADWYACFVQMSKMTTQYPSNLHGGSQRDLGLLSICRGT